MIYVMSDIHGYSEEFFKMLELIDLKPEDTLYILGDIIDRGDKAFEILDYVMEQENIKVLLGNHEQMMVCGLYGDRNSLFCWLENGGMITYKQFSNLSEERQIKYINFMAKLKTYEEINVNGQNYILSHAGMNIQKSFFKKPKETIMAYQTEADFIWSRDSFFTNKALGKDDIIIFGHTCTIEINAKTTKKSWDRAYIWFDTKYKDKIGIDCGASMRLAGGRLGCLRLDDKKEYYL